jgi:hypothetical protein
MDRPAATNQARQFSASFGTPTYVRDQNPDRSPIFRHSYLALPGSQAYVLLLSALCPTHRSFLCPLPQFCPPPSLFFFSFLPSEKLLRPNLVDAKYSNHHCLDTAACSSAPVPFCGGFESAWCTNPQPLFFCPLRTREPSPLRRFCSGLHGHCRVLDAHPPFLRSEKPCSLV